MWQGEASKEEHDACYASQGAAGGSERGGADFRQGLNWRGEQEGGCTLPPDLWLVVASKIPVAHFVLLGTLAQLCHGTRYLSRSSELWEMFCRQGFACPGCVPCDLVIHRYGWSWRAMFERRKRLRFDGFYYIATTKLLHGLVVAM